MRRILAAVAALAALSAGAAQVACTGIIDLVAGGKISVSLECPTVAALPPPPGGPTTPNTPIVSPPATPTGPGPCTMGGIPISSEPCGTPTTPSGLTPGTPPAGPAT